MIVRDSDSVSVAPVQPAPVPCSGRAAIFLLVSGMWAWNGSTWTRVDVPTLPTAEPPIRMLQHESIGLILVDGAYRGTAPATWIWSGSAWSTLAGAVPSRRIGFDYAFDAGRSRTVLFGGLGPGETPLADLWELGPNGWTQIAQ